MVSKYGASMFEPDKKNESFTSLVQGSLIKLLLSITMPNVDFVNLQPPLRTRDAELHDCYFEYCFIYSKAHFTTKS